MKMYLVVQCTAGIPVSVKIVTEPHPTPKTIEVENIILMQVECNGWDEGVEAIVREMIE